MKINVTRTNEPNYRLIAERLIDLANRSSLKQKNEQVKVDDK